ncbi:AAA family ATPase [Ruminococcaceae bacterium OttesenSCG-928-L11]|nr:AAA family ATPase [Ruminococcaceae bacterium OttesenSCG-928-L11]
MDNPCGIIVFGANGSGKTTLGAELARVLGFLHMDHEAYAFAESEIPYTAPRSRRECGERMLADIRLHRRFVLSAVTGDFGDAIARCYVLAVHLSAPLELRLKRYDQREYRRHGARMLPGGDLYESRGEFREFIASRSLSHIEQWAGTLTCPVLRLDGTTDWRTNAAHIAEQFRRLQGADVCL